jgi:lipoprotein signal peptidase
MCVMQATGRASLSGSAGPAAAGPRRVGVLLFTAVLVVVLDVVTKMLVVQHLSDRPPIRLLGGFLRLLETRNGGAAFGLGGGATVLFTVVAAGVVVAIARTAPRLRSGSWALTLGLLLGGATGNLVDRLLRSPGPLRGHVVDWISVPHWPVFNLADSAIVTGGLLAVLLATRGVGVDGRPVVASSDG